MCLGWVSKCGDKRVFLSPSGCSSDTCMFHRHQPSLFSLYLQPLKTRAAIMPDLTASRFTPQNRTTNERLSTNTVGLVALSDFRKRRAEVIEQQEREAREAAFAPAGGTKSGTGTATPNTPTEGTPDPDAEAAPAKKKLKKKAKKTKKLLSFDDDDEDDGTGEEVVKKGKQEEESENGGSGEKKGKFSANTAVGVVPKSLTKAALRKEAAEREALRQEFLSVQEAVKATEIAIPFVFYDGVNVPGGTVRVKKGDFTWLFLDKSRKLGAKLGSKEDKATRRKQWARVGVDDLLLVRGCAIIPHVSTVHSVYLSVCRSRLSDFP